MASAPPIVAKAWHVNVTLIVTLVILAASWLGCLWHDATDSASRRACVAACLVPCASGVNGCLPATCREQCE